uniref:Iron-sulfur cluster assembly protein n=1 Tax=Candidatus Methanomethylicus mesodigestus TaxID=1867258 RepID=A0A7C3F6F9_9CREN
MGGGIWNDFISLKGELNAGSIMGKEIEDKVIEALKGVMDPETGMSMVDMQLVSKVEESDGMVNVEFMPSSPMCPIAFYLAQEIKQAIMKVPGVKKAKVVCKGHMMEEQINKSVNEE